MATREVAADSAQAARQLVAIGLLWVGVVGAWVCLFNFAGNVLQPGTRLSGSTGLAGLIAFVFGAKLAIERGGLLELTRIVRERSGRSALRPWVCFFAHFRLGLAALGVALCAGWLLRGSVLTWWIEPFRWPAPGGSTLVHYSDIDSFAALLRLHVLVILATMPLFALPLFASDTWRLLLPLAEPSASRLRLPFVVLTSAIAMGTAWWFRSQAPWLLGATWQLPAGPL